MAKRKGASNSEFEVNMDEKELGLVGDDAGAEVEAEEEEFIPEVDVKIETAPKNPKAGWSRIMIDEVEGLGNSEVVSVNGKVYQIMRGEEALVPPEVIEVLKNSVATRIVQKTDPLTGEMVEERRNYSAIPWRKV